MKLPKRNILKNLNRRAQRYFKENNDESYYFIYPKNIMGLTYKHHYKDDYKLLENRSRISGYTILSYNTLGSKGLLNLIDISLI
jgi:hypothetical protein